MKGSVLCAFLSHNVWLFQCNTELIVKTITFAMRNTKLDIAEKACTV